MSNAAYRAPDECYWSGAEESFNVGIIGAGSSLRAILDIIFNDTFREFLPDMQLVAMCEFRRADRHGLEGLDHIPFYDTHEQMLFHHPEINLVVEMTGRAGLLAQLRCEISENVSVMDYRQVVFFCGLHDMALVKGHVSDNLAHQQTLMKSIMDEIQEDVILMDKRGAVVDLNRNVRDRSGQPREELIGKPCWNAVRLRDGSMFCDHFDEVCPFHKTLVSGQKEEALVSRVNRDGLLQYYRLYSYPIFDIRSNMSHIMVMHRDITKRTLHEKHQHQRDKLAVIGEMSTYLAHEIRNPLFAVGGFAHSLLKSPDLTGKDREKVDIIVEETERLDRLLTSMLNFSRPSPKLETNVDLVAVCHSAAELMTIGYSRSGYRIELTAEPSLPTVRGSEDGLKQCVVNLIKNSIEAMPGGGVVSVRLGLEDEYVALRVVDEGVGMSEHELEHVFSPFYSTKEEGSGLGLAMIKKIVEELGGRVELASKPGKGTTVTLLLPPSLDADTRTE